MKWQEISLPNHQILADGSMNTTRYLYFSIPVKLIMKTSLVSFNINEIVEDAGRTMMKTRYRSYPVVDDKNRLQGYVSRYHILNRKNKNVILVDHNGFFSIGKRNR